MRDRKIEDRNETEKQRVTGERQANMARLACTHTYTTTTTADEFLLKGVVELFR